MKRRDVKAISTKRQSKTNWKRVDALRDEDIDFSDIPELGPDFFANAIIWPGPNRQIKLWIDPDVLTFFRKHGRGYQTTINAVLRKYMEAIKRQAVRARNMIRRCSGAPGQPRASAPAQGRDSRRPDGEAAGKTGKQEISEQTT
jgi:uncharacterized protein (DUF4415 family)